jgi:hypothetical protein
MIYINYTRGPTWPAMPAYTHPIFHKLHNIYKEHNQITQYILQQILICHQILTGLLKYPLTHEIQLGTCMKKHHMLINLPPNIDCEF